MPVISVNREAPGRSFGPYGAGPVWAMIMARRL
jgi:hypothetical protein